MRLYLSTMGDTLAAIVEYLESKNFRKAADSLRHEITQKGPQSRPDASDSDVNLFLLMKQGAHAEGKASFPGSSSTTGKGEGSIFNVNPIARNNSAPPQLLENAMLSYLSGEAPTLDFSSGFGTDFQSQPTTKPSPTKTPLPPFIGAFVNRSPSLPSSGSLEVVPEDETLEEESGKTQTSSSLKPLDIAAPVMSPAKRTDAELPKLKPVRLSLDHHPPKSKSSPSSRLQQVFISDEIALDGGVDSPSHALAVLSPTHSLASAGAAAPADDVGDGFSAFGANISSPAQSAQQSSLEVHLQSQGSPASVKTGEASSGGAQVKEQPLSRASSTVSTSSVPTIPIGPVVSDTAIVKPAALGRRRSRVSPSRPGWSAALSEFASEGGLLMVEGGEDSDTYDDEEDVGYIRRQIEDEEWFLTHEVRDPVEDDGKDEPEEEEEVEAQKGKAGGSEKEKAGKDGKSKAGKAEVGGDQGSGKGKGGGERGSEEKERGGPREEDPVRGGR